MQKLYPAWHITSALSSKKFISLKKLNFFSKNIEFLSNILEPSPVKTKIHLFLSLIKKGKFILLKLKFKISSILACITFFSKSSDIFSFNLSLISKLEINSSFESSENIVYDLFKLFLIFSESSSLIFNTWEISLVIWLPPTGIVFNNINLFLSKTVKQVFLNPISKKTFLS